MTNMLGDVSSLLFIEVNTLLRIGVKILASVNCKACYQLQELRGRNALAPGLRGRVDFPVSWPVIRDNTNSKMGGKSHDTMMSSTIAPMGQTS